MSRLIFSIILLLGFFILVIFDRGYFFDQISAMPGDNITNDDLNNFPAPSIRGDLGIEKNQNNSLQDNSLQDQIQSELYNSISSGMSYEEVSSIIGWKGVLIYENEFKDGGEAMQTKVYQWNHEDVYSTDLTSIYSERSGIINPYWNLTLEFQNNLLVDKNISDLRY